MAETPTPIDRGASLPGAEPAPLPIASLDAASTPGSVSELNSLLEQLQGVSSTDAVLPPAVDESTDSRLVLVRLGVASSLFAALQCKHAATAGHALRVSLTCSAWAQQMGLEPEDRDTVEVAALLHDIGVIGVPDRILLKPGPLTADETAVMTRSRHKSLEILRHSSASPQVLEIVEHVPAWYNGARPGFRLQGERLPLGARMIAIAEAFDAMTTDRVYRGAMSQERAMTELFDCAPAQFDPALVSRFAEHHDGNPAQVREQVAGRWLQSLDPGLVNSYWQLNCVPSQSGAATIDSLFQAKLLENMYDAVVFIDAGGQVSLWNRGAQRLTGIAGSSVCQRHWRPELLNMADEKGNAVSEADCPVNGAIRSGVQSLRRMTIHGRTGKPVAVDSHAIPVIAEDGTTLGAVLLFHDASSESSLEQRCQNLHEKATRDPLTQVANRAEFDRVFELFVAAHLDQQVPCSLIIGDVDHFKRVNDQWGHQAGDEVLKNVAAVLKGSCRPGDLVARYGGEEFVVLCADCNNAAAARRAEQIRKALGDVAQPQMGGRAVTITFGVSEIQPGDTPETMLRRADRALLLGKERGRNCVVQLGTGAGGKSDKSKRSFWSRKPSRDAELLQRILITPVPVKMAIEKLRGFVSDHKAKIIEMDDAHVRLQIADKLPGRLRRLTDRPVVFYIELHLEEERPTDGDAQPGQGGFLRTRIQLSMSLAKNRDRRRNGVVGRARETAASLRSYLMASEEETPTTESV